MTARVTRLVTFVDLDSAADKSTVSVSARHDVELAGGSRAPLLRDRGWTSSGPADAWAHMTEQEIIDTARTVVGPDEPPDDLTSDDMAAAHWQELQELARQQTIEISADELRRLPHDVALSPRLRRRLRN